jgi:NADPH-dependent curcumin reductase CurA
MSPKIIRQWTLASRPSGVPSLQNFVLKESPLPPLEVGQVLLETKYLSVDPYVRGRMRNVKSYVPPYEIGDVIDGNIVGRVVASKDSRFSEGDYAAARLGWSDYQIAAGHTLRKVDSDPALLSAHVGLLGMTGLTAYFALLDIGKPQAGQTVLVSGAAGAVGSVVGQIAKINGCRAVGIAGSDDKVEWLKKDMGFDEAINYKTASNLRKAIRDACPNRVDVYFDNVGGVVSDAAVTQIAMRGRIIICGQISIINREEPELGPRNQLYLLVYRARMEGFLVHDYEARYSEGLNQLKLWLKEGKLKNRETVVNGLEKAPEAFAGLFTGENVGKMVVQL